MVRKFTPKVVTANDLLIGNSIWLTADNQWSNEMSDAQLIEDAELAEERLAFASAQQDRLVGAYLADAQAGENGPEPTHFREEFRTRGPSNYDHGKQAEV